jgi:hypothetical protein
MSRLRFSQQRLETPYGTSSPFVFRLRSASAKPGALWAYRYNSKYHAAAGEKAFVRHRLTRVMLSAAALPL